MSRFWATRGASSDSKSSDDDSSDYSSDGSGGAHDTSTNVGNVEQRPTIRCTKKQLRLEMPTDNQDKGSNDNPSMEQILDHLHEDLGINFVAFDFDQTILSIHTGGFWVDTVDKLAKHVRPDMRELLPRLEAHPHIHIAVVTFSSQPKMVRDIMDSVVLAADDHETCAAVPGHPIPIRGEDGSWKTPDPLHRNQCWWEGEEYEAGKQPHMVSGIQELEMVVDKLQITKATSLLIDDDQDNIQVAKENGVRAVWLDPEHPERLLADLLELE